jgi:ketosteroid isomerase-like protein
MKTKAPKEVLSIAAQFAAALDADDFEGAARLLAEDCVYEIAGGGGTGPQAIIASYRSAAEWGRQNLHEVIFHSEVEESGEDWAAIRFTDRVRHGTSTHVYHCRQIVTVSAGKICHIRHAEIPGEREALLAFFRAAGLKR